MRRVDRPESTSRPGYSLVEILVALGVVALLVAIALPAIRWARLAALDMTNASNMRSSHQDFRAWAGMHDDYFVNGGVPPEGERFTFDLGPGNGFVVGWYELQTDMWPLVLAPWLGEASMAWHSVYAPPPDEPLVIVKTIRVPHAVRTTSFVYSASMLYDPRAFDPHEPTPDDLKPHRRRVRWSETAHPSSKGLLYDSARTKARGGASSAVAFVDGAVALLDFRTSAVSGDDERFSTVSRTPRGVLGVDFKR